LAAQAQTAQAANSVIKYLVNETYMFDSNLLRGLTSLAHSLSLLGAFYLEHGVILPREAKH
jgi:hypothetical protein